MSVVENLIYQRLIIFDQETRKSDCRNQINYTIVCNKIDALTVIDTFFSSDSYCKDSRVPQSETAIINASMHKKINYINARTCCVRVSHM